MNYRICYPCGCVLAVCVLPSLHPGDARPEIWRRWRAVGEGCR